MINPMALDNKTIMVTGASSGIGKSVAILASELGAHVVLVARNREKLKETYAALSGTSHHIFTVDLGNVDQIAGLIKSLNVNKITLDGLVHSAGVAPKESLDYGVSKKTMDINVHAFNEIINQALTYDILCNKSSVVALSSTSAIRGDAFELSYAMSKAALEASVRFFAQYLKDKKIQVNAIQPGWVKTPMLETFLDAYGDTLYGQNDLNRQFLGAIDALEIANLIAFLLSDATTTITGSTYLIDGGFLL